MNSTPQAGRAEEPTGRIRILIADDHVTVREGLAAIIGRQVDMTVVAEASNGNDAVELWLKHRPDVTLMDLRMPYLDGVNAIDGIRARHPAARILVVTTFDTDNDISRAVKAGARGYLLKDAPREELLAYIRRVHAGEMCLPPALLAKLAATLADEALTRREVEVVALLASGKSNRDIGLVLEITETTVKSHMRSIFAKLDVLSRTEAVATATRRGLIDFDAVGRMKP
jgi:two-component system NarL family response regulator